MTNLGPLVHLLTSCRDEETGKSLLQDINSVMEKHSLSVISLRFDNGNKDFTIFITDEGTKTFVDESLT